MTRHIAYCACPLITFGIATANIQARLWSRSFAKISILNIGAKDELVEKIIIVLRTITTLMWKQQYLPSQL